MSHSENETPVSTLDSETAEIKKEVAALRRELETLNSQRFVTIYNKLWKLFLLRFTSGLFTGLGTVIGATVLVSLVVVWLQQIEWVPLIGDWATGIAAEIERNLEIQDAAGGNGSATTGE